MKEFNISGLVLSLGRFVLVFIKRTCTLVRAVNVLVVGDSVHLGDFSGISPQLMVDRLVVGWLRR